MRRAALRAMKGAKRRPCPHGGKRTYSTRRKARLAAEYISRTQEEKNFYYRCPKCGGWHITHQAPRKKVAA